MSSADSCFFAAIFSCTTSRRWIDALSVSFFSASFSMLSVSISWSIWSMTSGLDWCCSLSRDDASSSRSTALVLMLSHSDCSVMQHALSGRKRSAMYREDNVTAFTMAASVMPRRAAAASS